MFFKQIRRQIIDCSYFDMTLSGKQPPRRATTQSKCGEFCSNVLSSVAIQSSVSLEYNFPKHNAASPSKHRIAFDPSHSVHEEPISEEQTNCRAGIPKISYKILPIVLPPLYLLDRVPRIRRLHEEMSGAHAAGPFVTKFSSVS